MERLRADIYTGVETKHYSFPKAFLRYHSTCFDNCFNGHSAEAQSLKLELFGGEVEDLDSLFDHLSTGKYASHFTKAGELVDGEKKSRAVVERCLAFLSYYADSYDMGEDIEKEIRRWRENLCTAIHGRKRSPAAELDEDDIVLVHATAPVRHS